jgi:hypothetical protein
MSNLIANRFGSIRLNQDADCEPMFIYTFKDDNGKTDDCDYAFVFRDNEIHLYDWHYGHDTDFVYRGNWMLKTTDCEDVSNPYKDFHDHDYQDALVGRLRLCIKEALNNIVGSTIEYL